MSLQKHYQDDPGFWKNTSAGIADIQMFVVDELREGFIRFYKGQVLNLEVGAIQESPWIYFIFE